MQSLIVSESSYVKSLIIRASLCMQQCVICIAGFRRFTHAAKHLSAPIIAEAPSTQTLMQLLQWIQWVVKKLVGYSKKFLTSSSLWKFITKEIFFGCGIIIYKAYFPEQLCFLANDFCFVNLNGKFRRCFYFFIKVLSISFDMWSIVF